VDGEIGGRKEAKKGNGLWEERVGKEGGFGELGGVFPFYFLFAGGGGPGVQGPDGGLFFAWGCLSLLVGRLPPFLSWVGSGAFGGALFVFFFGRGRTYAEKALVTGTV